MKVLIAPDKFKGSLSAVEAAHAIACGFRAGHDSAKLEVVPIADGGEGFAETLGVALNGGWVETTARDPLGRDVTARYVWVDDAKLAVIDMSQASGLWRLPPNERDPMRASTFGTGQLMRHAAECGANTILVGLGGSATTDGGIGMAEALGYQFLTSDGDPVEAIPSNLLALTRINPENAIALPQVIAACDVENVFLGPRGTAHVFSPQKGADAKMVEVLELSMENLADVVRQDLGCDHRDTPGAGAAGGLGFGLLSFCNAKMRSGFGLVAETVQLEQRIARCDLVITGEGRIDDQTFEGKGPAGVAALARKSRKPILAFAGSVRDHAAVDGLFTATVPIVDELVTLDEAMRRGAEFLERAACRTGRLIKLGKAL